ncbi:MAG: DUF4198 domain-containing protein [Planctomycetota bacterium]
MKKLRIATVSMLMFVVSWTQAHEFWIRPEIFTPQIGSDVSLALRVGENFKGEPRPREKGHIRKFAWVGASGTPQDVAGDEGKSPAGKFTLKESGVVTAGYRSQQRSLVLEPEKFHLYLREEGLEHVIREREATGKSQTPGRETYSRCAKTLLCTGEPERGGHDRRLGFPLELVALQNPYALAADGKLEVLVLHEEKPLADAMVQLFQEDRAEAHVRLRTNAEGRVTLTLKPDAVYLVAVVHMKAAAAGLDADWESLWASLTFATRAKPQ